MKFLEKVRKLGKRAKIALSTAIATMSMAAFACVASAAESGDTATDMASVLETAGTTLQSSFNTLIKTMIPVLLGIAGSSLVIFAVMALFKFGKRIFGKVAG